MTKPKIPLKAGKLFILVILLLVSLPAFAQVDTACVRIYNGPGNLGNPAGNIDTNNAKEGRLLPVENLKGRSAGDFLTPDGRFDLKAIRASGYQGPLDLKGFHVGTDPRTGEPIFRHLTTISPTDDPDDIYWSPLGSGMNGGVLALAVYDSRLIAGGWFTTAGGVSANYIASWDGSTWSTLGSGIGGDNPYVYTLAVYDNKLIAGGYFTTAGGVSANYIASWDGSFWSALGSGMNGYGYVYALTVYDNKLIAGGEFTTAGGVSANYIASWDGSSWSALGSGMGGGAEWNCIDALAVYDNKLIAGGYFATAGGVSANYIASWDGSSWSALGSGMDDYVSALAVYDNKLIAGGVFTTAGGVSANYIASWDGSSWDTLGSGMNGGVLALAVYDSRLIAGGWFTTAGGVSANYIASWDTLGSGMNGYVYALAVYDNKLIAGGFFTTAGGKVSAYIAQWTKHTESPQIDLELKQLYFTSISESWDRNYVAQYPHTDTEYVGAVVKNNSTISLSNVEVQFTVDGVVNSRFISTIAPSGVVLVDVPWALSNPSTINKTVSVFVDPSNSFNETNENNNDTSTTVSIDYAVTAASNPPAGRAYDLREDAYGRFKNWELDWSDMNWDYVYHNFFYIDPNFEDVLRWPLWWLWPIICIRSDFYHCMGMSSTSALYFANPNYKPEGYENTHTFDMPFQPPVKRNIEKYHHFQCVEAAERYFFSPDELSELGNLITALGTDHRPMYLFGTVIGSGHHAVLAYKMIDFGDKKVINIYENSDLLSNEGQNVHVPSRVVIFQDNVFYYNSTEEYLDWNEYEGNHGLYNLGFPYRQSNSPFQKTLCRYPRPGLGTEFHIALLSLWDKIKNQIWQSQQISLSLECPAQAQITDSHGRRIGYFDTTFVNEIPGATLDTAFNTEVEFYLLPDSLSYSFTSVALDSGLMDVTLGILLDSVSMRVVRFDSIWNQSASTRTHMSFNRTTQNFSLQLDRDGDGNVDTTLTPSYDGPADFSFGDANGDGVINVTDVVYLINYLFLIPPGPAPIPLEAGDVNCEGIINVTDVVYLINYLFLVPPGPPPCE
jgi:hypothetical protein